MRIVVHIIIIIIGSGNGLLPDGTKPLPEPSVGNDHVFFKEIFKINMHETPQTQQSTNSGHISWNIL